MLFIFMGDLTKGGKHMRKIITFFVIAAIILTCPLTSMAASVNAEFVDGSGGMNIKERSASLVDGKLNTKWCTMEEVPYVIFKLPLKQSVTSYSLVTGNDTKTYMGRNPISWTLYGCNSTSVPNKDSLEWQIIHSVTDDTVMQPVNTTSYEFTLSQAAPEYQYYKFVVTDKNRTMQLAELILNIGGSSYISQNYITGSKGFNVRENADSLFDRNSGTKWCTAAVSPYVIFETSQPVSPTGYYIVTGNDNSQYSGRNPRSWTLYGCNSISIPNKDYTGWNKISSVTDDTVLKDVNHHQYYFDIPYDIPEYKYYMLSIDERNSNTMQISEFFINYSGANFSFSTSGGNSSENNSNSNSGTVSGLICGVCTGTGYRNNGEKCWACNGTGFVPQ